MEDGDRIDGKRWLDAMRHQQIQPVVARESIWVDDDIAHGLTQLLKRCRVWIDAKCALVDIGVGDDVDCVRLPSHQ